MCEPVFDYGRTAGGLDARRRRPARGRRHRRRPDGPAAHRHGAGIEGGRVRAPPRARARASRLLRADLGRGPRGADRRRRGRSLGSPHDASSGGNWLATGPHPRPPLARAHPAVGAHHQGTDVHADRRDGRRADDVVAGDAGRRAQLGLPVHLDARLHLHPPGPALPQPRLGGRRVHAVRRRPRAGRGRRACRSCTASTAGGT